MNVEILFGGKRAEVQQTLTRLRKSRVPVLLQDLVIDGRIMSSREALSRLENEYPNPFNWSRYFIRERDLEVVSLMAAAPVERIDR